MKKSKKETGRSMTEMIGAICLIILLLIAGLYGYKRIHAKVQVKSVVERLIALKNQRILYGLKKSGKNIYTDKNGPFGSELTVENGIGPLKDYFWIIVKKSDSVFCEEIVKADVGAMKADAQDCPEESTFYFFKSDKHFSDNDDPDKKDQPEIECPEGYYDSESSCDDDENAVAHDIEGIKCYTCEPISCDSDLIRKRYCEGTQCKTKMCCPDDADCTPGSCSSCPNGPSCTPVTQRYCDGTQCKTQTCCGEDSCTEGGCSNCCESDTDCTDPLNPKCDISTHTCVPCLESEKVYPEKRNTYGCCVEDTSLGKKCPSATSCTNTCPYCKTDGTCGCKSDDDCKDSSKPKCDTSTHTCVPCLESEKVYPKILNSNGCCVEDTSSGKTCPSVTSCTNTCPYCKTDGTCECKSDADCKDSSKPKCDTSTHTCVPCLESEKVYPKKRNTYGCCVDDTSSGKKCPSETSCTNTCPNCKTDGTCGCISNTNCPSGQVCQSGNCVTPECLANTDCHSTSDACPTCSNYQCSFTYETSDESCCTSHNKHWCASNSYWDRCKPMTECCANDKPTDACAEYYTCTDGEWTLPDTKIVCSVKSGRRTTTGCYSTDEYKKCSDGTTCVAKTSCCDADKPTEKRSECYMCNALGEWVFNPDNDYPAECGCPDDASYSCSCFLPMVTAGFELCNSSRTNYCFTVENSTITYKGSMSLSKDLDISSCNLVVQDASSSSYRADFEIWNSATMKVKNFEMTTATDSGSTMEIGSGSSVEVSENLTMTNATINLYGSLDVKKKIHIKSTVDEINDEAIEGGDNADLNAGEILIDSNSRRDAISFSDYVYIHVTGDMNVNSAVDLGGFDIGGKLTISENPIAYSGNNNSLLSITVASNVFSDPSYIRKGADIRQLNLGASLYVTGGDLKVTNPNYSGISLGKSDIVLSVQGGSIISTSKITALRLIEGNTVSASGDITATCTGQGDGIIIGYNGGVGEGNSIYNDCSKEPCGSGHYKVASLTAGGTITGETNTKYYGYEGIDAWCADIHARQIIGKSDHGNGMVLYHTNLCNNKYPCSYQGIGGTYVSGTCTSTYPNIRANCSTPAKNTTKSTTKCS